MTYIRNSKTGETAPYTKALDTITEIIGITEDQLREMCAEDIGCDADVVTEEETCDFVTSMLREKDCAWYKHEGLLSAMSAQAAVLESSGGLFLELVFSDGTVIPMR